MNKIDLNNLLQDDSLIKDIDSSFDVEIFKNAFHTTDSINTIIDSSKPLVSFIVPTHNRYNMLKQTLKVYQYRKW